jgi:hypothetical protein
MRSFFLVSFIFFLRFFSFAQDNSFIDWKANQKLIWDDFRQRPDPSSPNAALTSSVIRYDFSYNSAAGLIFHIRCQFDKNTSWARVKTDYILSHEQGHFDITEIYARRLFKAFKDYPATPSADIKKDINKIYVDIMHQLQARQADYDKETSSSLNKPEQEEWLKKISEELKQSEAFGNYN